MKENLLILGAGAYGSVAKDIAVSTNRFKKIDFLDDVNPCAIGKLQEYSRFVKSYSCAVVAIGNPSLRLEYIEKLTEAGYNVCVLQSPQAYVSSSAQIGKGCIIEPMSVVNANATLGTGVIVCASAVVNHDSRVDDGCQIDCGSVIGAHAHVPTKTKVAYNAVYTV